MPENKIWQASDIEGIRLPCWYELLPCNDPVGLTLSVHQDVFCKKNIFATMPLATWLERDFEIGTLETNPQQFGYGKSFHFRNFFFRTGGGNYLRYGIPFPQVEVIAGICNRCNGSGKDQYQDKCISCNGTGQATKYEWTKIFQTCASLSTFFSLAELCPTAIMLNHHKPENQPSTCHQLMGFYTGMTSNSGRQSFPLSGHFSADFVKWLVTNKGKEQARDVMLEAWRKMFIAPPYESYFRIMIECSGSLVIQLSGDCFVYPAQQSTPSPNYGYGFTSHYTDSPAYQLILLAGLASLWQSAKEFYEKHT